MKRQNEQDSSEMMNDEGETMNEAQDECHFAFIISPSSFFPHPVYPVFLILFIL
jgi:hypothetical protein